MVANAGVLELLTNFVCAANSRNIDISNIVMFATDEEGKKVAEEVRRSRDERGDERSDLEKVPVFFG
jgi:hypothetical protein